MEEEEANGWLWRIVRGDNFLDCLPSRSCLVLSFDSELPFLIAVALHKCNIVGIALKSPVAFTCI